MAFDEPPIKRPPWRPTEYKPELCDQVLEWGAAGKSRAWIAAKVGVSRQTLHTWTTQYPDFLDALDRAKVLEQMWWEDAGQDGMTGDKFNGQVWGRSMAARFPDDWREKSEVDMNARVQVTEVKRTIVDPQHTDS
jgi:hypothetical protein